MKILESLKEYKIVKERIINDFKDNFFKELFELYPQLNFIPITSYTPSFNDGDPCTRYLTAHLDLLDALGDYDLHDYLDLKYFIFGDIIDEEFILEILGDNTINYESKSSKLHQLSHNFGVSIDELKEIEEILEQANEFLEHILEDQTVSLIVRNTSTNEIEIITADFDWN